MFSSSVRQPGAGAVSNFIRYWLPVAAWMALIFTASADSQSSLHSSLYFEPLLRWLFPHLPPAQVEAIHHVFRKCCHLTEYAILAWLLWRAIRKPIKNDCRAWHWDEAGLALAVVFLYAASDELHQVFVPSRTGQISDVLVDTSGAAIGLGLLWVWKKLRKVPDK